MMDSRTTWYVMRYVCVKSRKSADVSRLCHNITKKTNKKTNTIELHTYTCMCVKNIRNSQKVPMNICLNYHTQK